MNRDRKWALAEMGYADMLLECGRLLREITRLTAEVARLQDRIRTLEEGKTP